MKRSSEMQQRTRRPWQLQDAKNRLSEVVDRARRQGPQTITLRGKPAAVVVSFEEFSRLTQPPLSLVEFLQHSPLSGMDLQLERSRDTGREVDL